MGNQIAKVYLTQYIQNIIALNKLIINQQNKKLAGQKIYKKQSNKAFTKQPVSEN